MKSGVFELFVIYRHPRDFPNHWVVRAQAVAPGGRVIAGTFGTLCDSLGEAREEIPEGLACIGRMDDDDPAIYEVWI